MEYPKTTKKCINIIRHNKRTTTKNRAREKELMSVDYKATHKGSTLLLLTTGSTEISAHDASDTHEKSDLQYSALCNEYNW